MHNRTKWTTWYTNIWYRNKYTIVKQILTRTHTQGQRDSNDHVFTQRPRHFHMGRHPARMDESEGEIYRYRWDVLAWCECVASIVHTIGIKINICDTMYYKKLHTSNNLCRLSRLCITAFIERVHFSFREFSENHQKKTTFLELRYPIITESVNLYY